MAWSPQRSKDTYAAIRSMAYARTYGGTEFPPDPAFSVMYLVSRGRRRIWALKPNLGSGPPFQVIATRGPVNPVPHPVYGQSVMGDIGGDSTGAWYIEYFNTSLPVSVPGGPPVVTLVDPYGHNHFLSPILHRLNPDLSFMASYSLVITHVSAGIFSIAEAFPGYVVPLSEDEVGAGGFGSNSIIRVSRHLGENYPINFHRGLVLMPWDSLFASANHIYSNGTSHVALYRTDMPPYPNLPGAELVPFGPLTPGDESTNFVDKGFVTHCDGDGTRLFVGYNGGAGIIASFLNGELTAIRRSGAYPQNEGTQHTQSIGGGSGACFTTDNNNEVVFREPHTLNVIRRITEPEINSILGQGSHYLFCGIGGR